MEDVYDTQFVAGSMLITSSYQMAIEGRLSEVLSHAIEVETLI